MLLLEKPVVIFRDGSERRKIKINEENLYNLFSKINEQDVYRYQRFWSEMHPFTEIDYYRSWLYALITVYMPEKRSTPLFEHLADINPRTMTFDYVDALLRRHRTGMYNVVGKAIADFTQV